MSVTNTLGQVTRWMSFYGWTDGGNPGSVKRDVHDQIIAHHGDAAWIKDVEDALERIEREAILADLERRERMQNRRAR